jgi:hypothetical protein
MRAPSGNVLQLTLSTDTRGSLKEVAELIAYSKKQALEGAGYECQTQVEQLDAEQDERYERRFSQKRAMNTFLFFIDQDGFKNVLSSPNTKGEVWDRLCEMFLVDMGKKAREARCITGTQVFYR